MKRKQIYSYDLAEVVSLQIPEPILEAMNRCGWNAFGIYEIVRDAIKREKAKK